MLVIKGYVYVARVIWQTFEASPGMSMSTQYHCEDVAYCSSYEDAIVSALPICRQHTKNMQACGFGTHHAEIDVRMEYITGSLPSIKDQIEERRNAKANETKTESEK